MRDRRFPLRFTWTLSSSGMLHSVDLFRTDVSGLRISPIFKGQDVQEEAFFLNSLTPEDGTET
jgi:hypothetical protein